MKQYDLDEYIEKLKRLSEHGQQEVCILIDFMEYIGEKKEGENV